MSSYPTIREINISAFTIPTEAPEADGTFACCSIPRLRHVEYFHDHVRIERMLFDGFIEQKDGFLQPDTSSPGMGLTFKKQDAQRLAA